MRFLAVVGFLAILAAIGAGVYFLGGFFNVGATRQDPAFVSSAIIYVRQASIGRHAVDQPPMNLEDPATIQAGAKAFSQRGCVNCHGGHDVRPVADAASRSVFSSSGLTL